jgi:2,3-dihydroxybenzoate-AMP ligase
VGDSELSYGALAQEVTGWEQALTKAGIKGGQIIGLLMANTVDFLEIFLALMRLGAVPILIVPKLGPREVAHVLNSGPASALIVDGKSHRGGLLNVARITHEEIPRLRMLVIKPPAQLERSEAPLDRIASVVASEGPGLARRDGLAFFLLSGGTTGPPKLIPRTHADYAYNLRVAAEAADINEASTYLAALPIAHNFALGCPGILGVLSRGGRVVLSSRPDASNAFPLIERWRATMTSAVPALALDWCAAATSGAFDLSSLGLIQIGGARLYREQALQIIRCLNCRLQQVYGMAEGLLNFTRLDDPLDVVLDTQGRPASAGDECRIVTEAGNHASPGGVGELLVRGPYTIRGYHGGIEVNSMAFTRDGFYKTGDLVRLHPSGNFIVEGRTRDVINRAGEKIAAAELEAILSRHPSVAMPAVIGVPDRRLGERVCLCVVPRPGCVIELLEIRDFLRASGVAPYKLPERLQMLDELPLTAVGKVDKAALRRRMHDSALEASTTTGSHTGLEEQ